MKHKYGPLQLELSGQKTYCSACQQYFKSTYAFDQHRIGKYTPINSPSLRRCLTVQELDKAGWAKNGEFWMTPKRRTAPWRRSIPEAIT